jgi:hypothetical protein
MTGQKLLEELRGLCRDIDEGRPLRRLGSAAIAPAVISLSLGVAGCSDEPPPGRIYAAPMPAGPAEVCDDGTDNDDDGLTDCADSDCEKFHLCLPTPEYAAPLPDRDPDPGTTEPPPDSPEAPPPVALYSVRHP